MSTRREFTQTVVGATAALAVARCAPGDQPAARRSQAEPQAGHFHPKGKAPSEYTRAILEQARATLPFSDERDFE